MNIVRHLEELITRWNEENKCGYCWQFIGAGREDLFNMFTDINESQCCVYVGLINISFGTKYFNVDAFTKREYCFLDFKLFIGIPSRLDLQFYNEIANTDQEKEESKWSIINGIKECIGCDWLEILCDDETYAQPSEMKAELKLNYQDSNYDGWFVTGRYIY